MLEPKPKEGEEPTGATAPKPADTEEKASDQPVEAGDKPTEAE